MEVTRHHPRQRPHSLAEHLLFCLVVATDAVVPVIPNGKRQGQSFLRGSGGLLTLPLYSTIMDMPQPSFRHTQSRDAQLPLASLLLSLLLHLLVILLVLLFVEPSKQPEEEEPTLVRLVELPDSRPQKEKNKAPDFEIDQQPQQPRPEKPVKSRRKAARDQRVDQEQAPRADDVRDQVAEPPRPATPPTEPSPAGSTAAEKVIPSTSQPAPAAVQTPPRQSAADSNEPPRPEPEETGQASENSVPASEKVRPEPEPTTQTTGTVAPSAPEPEKTPAISQAPREPAPPIEHPEAPNPPPPSTKTPPPKLSPQQLFPDAKTLSRIADSSLGERERRKKREDVEIGDTVWLNLQHDLLVSFFRRFHDRIERVWNYPTEAAQNGIEGTLQLLIIVDRDGKLLDVDLLHSSNSDTLDFEAIQAIYRAAPFGPLTRHYPHATLKIRANFRYTLVGQYIFGRP